MVDIIWLSSGWWWTSSDCLVESDDVHHHPLNSQMMYHHPLNSDGVHHHLTSQSDDGGPSSDCQMDHHGQMTSSPLNSQMMWTSSDCPSSGWCGHHLTDSGWWSTIIWLNSGWWWTIIHWTVRWWPSSTKQSDGPSSTRQSDGWSSTKQSDDVHHHPLDSQMMSTIIH